MSKSPRLFLTGAAVVVLLGLGTGLVAYYNGGLPGVRETSDEELAYLPANAVAVACMARTNSSGVAGGRPD